MPNIFIQLINKNLIMKTFVQVFILSLFGITFLQAQESSQLNPNSLDMRGDNGGRTFLLSGDLSSGDSKYSSLKLYRTTSETKWDRRVLLSSGINEGGYLGLEDGLGNLSAALYGDYIEDNNLDNNHGRLFLRAHTSIEDSQVPNTTANKFSTFQPLIRFANVATSTEWDIGVYQVKLRAFANLPVQDLGTQIAYRYEGSTVARLSTTGNWSQISDRRLKTNIRKLDEVLNKLLKINPANYEMKNKLGVTEYGFIAQNLAEQFPELVSREFGEEEDRYLVNYTGMIPILTKAIQEQTIDLKKKEEEIATLKRQAKELSEKLNKVEHLDKIFAKAKALEEKLTMVTEIEERLYQIENNLQSCCMKAGTRKIDTDLSINKETLEIPILEQNTPNPFNVETTIQYFLPSITKNASIVLSDITGRIIKEYKLEDNGFGNVLIGANELKAGKFIYSLLIDGKVIQSKKMLITQ